MTQELTSQLQPSPGIAETAEAEAAAAPHIVIEAVYRDGLIQPAAPLDLPPDTPLHLQITLRPAAAATQDGQHDSTAASLSPDGTHATQTADAAATGARPRLLVPLAAALALAGLGHYFFLEAQGITFAGVVLYLLAIAVFALTLIYQDHPWLRGQEQPPEPTEQAWVHPLPWLRQSVRHRPWRLAAMGGAVLLTSVLLYLLQRDPPLPSYNWTLLLWFGTMGLYVYAVAPAGLHLPTLRRANLRGWLAADWPLKLAVALIVLLGFVLRVWDLGNIPPTVGGDEGSQGLEAIQVLEGDIGNPFSTGWLGVPTLSFYFNALTIGPLGNTILALRLPWALVGTLTVLVVFLLVRRLCGLTMGLVTAALFATYHYHIHFSRLGSNQVADTLFVALALWFLYRGYDERRPLDWALCGVVIGASQYFYAGARFTAVLVAAVIVLFVIRDGMPFIRQRWPEVLALAGAALIVGAPMIQYALNYPDDYNARINQVGIVQSGWLAREQELRNQGPLPILFDQAQRAFLAFNFYSDRNVWYGSHEPLMDFTAAALFLLGAIYSLLHIGDRRIFPMLAWWGGATIMGGALTESPPSSQRLITLAAPAIFFVALVLVRVGQLVLQSPGLRRLQWLPRAYLAVAVLALSAISVHWYFAEFTPMYLYGSYNGVVATSIGHYARDELGPDWRMYFFGPPRMYIGFGTIPYLAPDVEGEDVPEPLTAPPDNKLVKPDKNAVFIFLPERRQELELVRQAFPHGQLEQVSSPVPDASEPLYILYRVPRTQIEQK